MAIPTLGEFGMSLINRELRRSTTSQISLDTAENGGYGAINPASPSRPSASNPAAMSEWRGYDHSATSGPTLFNYPAIGYNINNQDTACFNAGTGRFVRIAGDAEIFPQSTTIYTNTTGTTFAAAGWYADDLASEVRFWNGSTFTIRRLCRI